MRPDERTVQHAWLKLVELSIPDASEAQLREIKRVFYAGAGAMFILVTDLGELSDGGAEAVLTSLWDECTRYKQAVMEGRE